MTSTTTTTTPPALATRSKTLRDIAPPLSLWSGDFRLDRMLVCYRRREIGARPRPRGENPARLGGQIHSRAPTVLITRGAAPVDRALASTATVEPHHRREGSRLLGRKTGPAAAP